MKISQKKFFEILKRRVITKGFKLFGTRIREKRTGNCPVTAVVQELTKKKYRIDDWDIAANICGIDWKFAENIVEIADNKPWDNEELNQKRLRNKLLKITGLK